MSRTARSMLLRFVKREARRWWSGRARAPPAVERRTGAWHHEDLAWMARLVRHVPGDFAEIGVFRGAAFRKLAALAHEQGRTTHAFDSFRGMAAPQPEDGGQYAAGKFDIGGADAFVRLMGEAGVAREWYRVWAGYIPDCFTDVPPDTRFSLVVVDVDHYRPTADSLAWAAPRIAPGGVLALDDFVPAHDRLATRAIREFLDQQRGFERIAEFNQQLILRRTGKA